MWNVECGTNGRFIYLSNFRPVCYLLSQFGLCQSCRTCALRTTSLTFVESRVLPFLEDGCLPISINLAQTGYKASFVFGTRSSLNPHVRCSI